MCIDYHKTRLHTSLIVFIARFSWRSRWVELSAMVLRPDLVYLASRMRFFFWCQSWKLHCIGIAQIHHLMWNICCANGWRHRSCEWSCQSHPLAQHLFHIKWCICAYLWYNKLWRFPLGAVNFLYEINSLKSIEFLFEREFMYVWNRKIFYMICSCL